MVESLNGIHIESYMRVKWLNLSLNGILIESYSEGLMIESFFEWNSH